MKTGQMAICKVRGITRNFNNSLDINFDTVTTNSSNVVSAVDDQKLLEIPLQDIYLPNVRVKITDFFITGCSVKRITHI